MIRFSAAAVVFPTAVYGADIAPPAGTGSADGRLEAAQVAIDAVMHWIAAGIEVTGVVIIVIGAVVASALFVHGGFGTIGWPEAYRRYRANFGFGILLERELPVAVDIVGTAADRMIAKELRRVAGVRASGYHPVAFLHDPEAWMERFSMVRVLNWGDCDPAGILYTPRIFDHITETVEAWFRDVVGVDWLTLIRQHNYGAPTVHTACDFLRPMRPDLVFRVLVLLDRVGGSSLSFRVVGEDEQGQRYFEAKLVSCITDFSKGRPVPMPPTIRERAETYFRICQASA